jgi:hypothetical protein
MGRSAWQRDQMHRNADRAVGRIVRGMTCARSLEMGRPTVRLTGVRDGGKHEQPKLQRQYGCSQESTSFMAVGGKHALPTCALDQEFRAPVPRFVVRDGAILAPSTPTYYPGCLLARSAVSPSGLNSCKIALATLALASLESILLPGSVLAQQSVALELGVGLTASSALVRDSVVRQSVLERLAGKGHVFEQVRAVPTIAPTIRLSVRTVLRPDLQLEGTAGWSFGRLRSGTGADSRTYQSFNVASGTIGMRYALRHRVHVRGGFGAVHYGSGAEGIFQQGGALEPVVEAAIGSDAHLKLGGVSIEAFGQAHRFGTPSLRQIAGTDGTVIRGGLMVGASFGSRR